MSKTPCKPREFGCAALAYDYAGLRGGVVRRFLPPGRPSIYVVRAARCPWSNAEHGAEPCNECWECVWHFDLPETIPPEESP